MRSSSAINDNKRVTCRADLDARGISPVASRVQSGLGYRTTSPPELYPHVASTKPYISGCDRSGSRLRFACRVSMSLFVRPRVVTDLSPASTAASHCIRGVSVLSKPPKKWRERPVSRTMLNTQISGRPLHGHRQLTHRRVRHQLA